MSKISRIRLININYNHDAIRISDETFDLNGESTLLSLQNGGGKSVLVQMITAPFVHGRYRNVKNRKFSSYFTSPQPSFILVEWALDQGAGYVMTGMMVRKNPKLEDSGQDQLEIQNVISVYREDCENDIAHLPVIEHDGKSVHLKTFGQCKTLFDQYRRNPEMDFASFDMNNSAQSREYFRRLQEFRINYREWENIIHKVNEQESGLGELFSDCKTEKDLIEKWFLDEIEKKLTRGSNPDDTDGSRMRGYQDLTEKYILSCAQNETQIRRRDTVQLFREDGKTLLAKSQALVGAKCARLDELSTILSFRSDMEKLAKDASFDATAEEDQISQVEDELKKLTYEELSGRWYAEEDNLEQKTKRQEEAGQELDDKKEEQQETIASQHRLELAGLFADVLSAKADLSGILQQMEVARQNEQELAPERNFLGFSLNRWYQEQEKETGQKRDAAAAEKDEAEAGIRKAKEAQKDLRGQITQAEKKIAGLTASVKAYDRIEADYNRRFGRSLLRSIDGTYPDGMLQKEEEDVQSAAKSCKKEQASLSAELSTMEGKIRSAKDAKKAALDAVYENQRQQEIADQTLRELENEIGVRKDILKYASLSEENLYSTDRILEALSAKRSALDDKVRALTLELSSMDNELQSLTNGKSVELPKALHEALEKLGIAEVSGLQWTRRNGRSKEENRALLQAHPFLPYALIVSREELQRLHDAHLSIYTTSPIPLVTRESLAEGSAEGEDGPVRASDGTLFYMLFNEHLLDEKELARMIEELKGRRQNTFSRLQETRQESDAYFRRAEILRSQKLTLDGYMKAQKDVQDLAAEREALLLKQKDAEDAESALLDRKQLLQKSIEEAGRKLEALAGQERDLKTLQEQYQVMLEDAAERKRQECLRADLTEKEKEEAQTESSLGLRDRELIRAIAELSGALKDLTARHAKYAAFASCEKPDSIPETALADAAAMEARFAAIEERTSGRLRGLEEDRTRAQKSLDQATRKLENKEKRYGMEQGDYEGVTYSEEEDDHLSRVLNRIGRELEALQGALTKASSDAAVAKSRCDTALQRIREETGFEEPMDKREVSKKDFAGLRKKLAAEKEEHVKQKNALERKAQLYTNMQVMFDGYERESGMEDEKELEEDFTTYSSDALRAFGSDLMSTYRRLEQEQKDTAEDLRMVLDTIGKKPAYQEEFFQRPIQTLKLVLQKGDAGQVESHLSDILLSIDRTMEKLSVDLAFVERDRKQLIGQLFDYVRSVHAELGKMDANSTIRLHERAVKMLKIVTPSFEDNESIYRARLEEMFDHLVKTGLESLKSAPESTALHDLVGRSLTTRQLFDGVVGTANVHLQIYKVETDREVQISWSEVASNSGGEGFVSAFVILSSLLYYMRRDENDIFADRNEGKVLVMDNPFGVASSAHLLRPMMEMAKKNNTQLICLSALSGGEIYDRFDNIYVLNLVHSASNRSQQYLKSTHKSGTQVETISSARVEVQDKEAAVNEKDLLF